MQNNQTYAELVKQIIPDATDSKIAQILFDCNVDIWTYIAESDLKNRVKAWKEADERKVEE